MSKPSWPLLDANAVGDTIASLKKGLVPVTQRALVDLRAMLTNGLTFKENMNAAIITLGNLPGGSAATLTNGVEYLVANPLRGKPIGFYPIFATDAAGIADEVETECELDVSRPDGLLGITCRFAKPFGAASVYIAGAASQANNSALAVDTTAWAVGGCSLSASGTVGVRCAYSGIVNASYGFELGGSAAGTLRRGFLMNSRLGAATDIAGRQTAPVTGAQTAAITGNGLFEVTAGDTIQCIIQQDTGAALGLVAGARRNRIDVHYILPPSTKTGTVTGILVGG